MRARWLWILLGMAWGATPVAAQCWDCQIHLFEGSDCYMDACTATFLNGYYAGCEQKGECGDADTCELKDGMCNPFKLLLDGRTFSGGLGTMDSSELLEREGVVVFEDRTGTHLILECTGAVVSTVRSPGQVAAVRARTGRLVL